MGRSWLVVLGALGCGRLGFDERGIASSDAAGDTGGACATFGPWSTPTRLAALDLGGNEAGAQISPDGLTLLFDSDVAGSADLFVATRADRQSPFGAPVALASVNTNAFELDATATDDQLELYFTRPSCIFRSTRASLAASWGAPSQVAMICGTGSVAGPYITPDGLELYYNTAVSNSEGALMASSRTDRAQAFAAGSPVAGLASLSPSGYMALSADRLSVYFESGTPLDVYVASRADLASPFGAPQQIGAIDEAATDEEDPSITADGLELYFASTRSGTILSDLFVTTRACVAP